ncbi:MAG: SDR family NAD(P)-dependent oxidoreductase [Clostridiales Family XIII bacterium]|jgi:NAD(P)-dependent dehydrogenase (short-subunit alcohol dehydrogenase family)|nr:SDR family NAD(P)-dependent oxidoreductase [Clostridiales Family XIII bacterium]
MSLDGKTAIITGYGGIGYEVALAIASLGASVIIAGRDRDKGEAAAAEISRECDSANVAFEHLDLFDPDSIRTFADNALASRDCVDMILCVAGVMMPDELELTGAGVERQFAVNYLGHYELVGRLMPLLLKSDDGRVVTVSSIANRPTRFDLGDATAARGYNASVSYALSKLCCLMYAVELGRRMPGVTACCVHPGLARTMLFNRSGGFTMGLLRVIFFIVPVIRQSARAAARPVVYAATSPDAVSGAYYGPLLTIIGSPRRALMPLRAKNRRLREELWSLSEKLTGVAYE